MGLYFENFKLVYSGVYNQGAQFESERPEQVATLEELMEVASKKTCGN